MPNDDTITLAHTPSDSAGAKRADLVIPRQLGSVTLIRELGRGGMGSVWLGRDDLLGREVAVKFLLNAVTDADDPGFVRFLDGARAAAAVRHPCLTAMLAAELVGGVPYLVMEYVDGPTVAAALEHHGPLPPDSAHAIMDAVADAIGELHERGIIHRDIKPANVLLDIDGRAYVTDFGLAFRRESLSSESAVAGTPAYMAPEIFSGTVTPRGDVFAMGVMLFELLTGRRPFEPSQARVGERPPRGPLPVEPLLERNVPDAVIEVIERAVNENPMFRHKSAAHFRQALREASGFHATAAHSSRPIAVLVAKMSATPGNTSADAPPAQSTKALSYFDELSNIAARRRVSIADSKSHDSPAIAPAVPTDNPGESTTKPASMHQTNAAMPDELERLSDTHAVPCAKCAYDLRGLALQAQCPECGAPVAESADPNRLAFASSGWLKRVVVGLGVIRISVAIAPIALAVVVFMAQWNAIPSERMAAWLGLAISICATIGPVVGLWMVTSPEPNRASAERGPARRARAGALIWVVLLYTWAAWSRQAAIPLPALAAMAIAMSLCHLLALRGFGLTVAQIVERIPNVQLAKRMRVDSAQFASLLAVAPLLYFLANQSLIEIEAGWFKVVNVIFFLFLIAGAFWFWFKLGTHARAIRHIQRISQAQ